VTPAIEHGSRGDQPDESRRSSERSDDLGGLFIRGAFRRGNATASRRSAPCTARATRLLSQLASDIILLSASARLRRTTGTASLAANTPCGLGGLASAALWDGGRSGCRVDFIHTKNAYTEWHLASSKLDVESQRRLSRHFSYEAPLHLPSPPLRSRRSHPTHRSRQTDILRMILSERVREYPNGSRCREQQRALPAFSPLCLSLSGFQQVLVSLVGKQRVSVARVDAAPPRRAARRRLRATPGRYRRVAV